MPTEMRELLAITSPVVAEVDDTGTDVRNLIKGFVSVERVDRSKDLVDPREFNIDQFMAAPVLMVNHKYWIDSQGNQVGVGRPIQLSVAKLAKNADDDTIWDVVDVKTRKVVSTFPKQKVPDLKKGDRGLFVIAEVTQSEVWAMAKRGELGAFSWRGLVQVDFKATLTGVQRLLKNIDLFEISLVHIPDNPHATFTLGKSVFSDDEGGPVLAHIHLSKTRFETREQAVKWLEDHKLLCDTVKNNPDEFIARQNDGEFNTRSFVRAKMSDGVYFVCGDLVHKELEVHRPWLTQVIGEEEIKELSSLWTEEVGKPFAGYPDFDACVADQKKKGKSDEASRKICGTLQSKLEGKSVENEENSMTTAVTDKAKTEDSVVEKTTSEESIVESTETNQPTEAEKAADVLASRVADSVANSLKPTLEIIGETLKGVASILQTITKEAVPIVTDTEETEEDKEKAIPSPAVQGSPLPNNKVVTGEVNIGKQSTGTRNNKLTMGQINTEAKKEESTVMAPDDTDSENSQNLGLEDVQKMLGQLGQALLTINSKVDAVAKSAPLETTREEKIEAAKNANADPNAVFNSIWPFIG